MERINDALGPNSSLALLQTLYMLIVSQLIVQERRLPYTSDVTFDNTGHIFKKM
jgi:hypothetical protein